MFERGQGLSAPTHQHAPSASDHAPNLVELLGLDPEGATWRDSALCAQVDPDLHFPDKGGSTRPAKSLCGRCEVRQECLDYALANDERHGIWGGLSERERRRLRLGPPGAQRGRPRPVAAAVTAPRKPAERRPRRAPRPWTTEEAKAAIHECTSYGMTAAEIAKQLGISTRTVERIRSQQRRVA